MPQVSSAELRSRSTTRTRAPSRANSNAVARPLPIVSPGVCPPPTTTAVFPSSLPVTDPVLSIGLRRSTAGASSPGAGPGSGAGELSGDGGCGQEALGPAGEVSDDGPHLVQD